MQAKLQFCEEQFNTSHELLGILRKLAKSVRRNIRGKVGRKSQMESTAMGMPCCVIYWRRKRKGQMIPIQAVFMRRK